MMNSQMILLKNRHLNKDSLNSYWQMFAHLPSKYQKDKLQWWVNLE